MVLMQLICKTRGRRVLRITFMNAPIRHTFETKLVSCKAPNNIQRFSEHATSIPGRVISRYLKSDIYGTDFKKKERRDPGDEVGEQGF